jgi:hypothetical protein
MRLSRFQPAAALVVLSLLVLPGMGCRKKQVPLGLPAQPTPEAQPQNSQASPNPAPNKPAPTPPSQTSAAPAASGNPSSPAPTPTPKDENVYQKNKPPTDQPPPPKRAARPANPSAPVVQGPTQSTPAADAPNLGDVLTPDQQKQYNAAIDQSLTHAQASLGGLANRQLSQEQQATMAQVQSFIEQAQEKRKTDLAAAKSLAERADVLANDLVASLR